MPGRIEPFRLLPIPATQVGCLHRAETGADPPWNAAIYEQGELRKHLLALSAWVAKLPFLWVDGPFL